MQCLQLIINSAWTLLTGWHLPGLGFTPAMFLCFLIVFKLVIDFVISIFNGSVSAIPSRVNYSNKHKSEG